MDSKVEPLKPESLFRRCDPEQLPFETTDQLEDLTQIIGLDRVAEAVRLGTEIQHQGFNLYALGPAGIGKHSVIRPFIEERAARQPAPADWCYVNNFNEPYKPRTLELPAGTAVKLRLDMEKLVEELRSAIPAAFDSEDYRTRKQVIEEEFKERQEKVFDDLREKATEQGLTLLQSPLGLVFAPVRDGEVLTREEYQELSEEARKQTDEKITDLQKELQSVLRRFPQWEREGRQKIKELNREVATYATVHLVDELRKRYREFPALVKHLDAVQQDVIENVEHFIKPPQGPQGGDSNLAARQSLQESPFFRRYQVNVLVDHAGDTGAPVVYEDHPTFQNLVGQLEHLATMGTLVTDFNLIKAGALHRANGGYLILDAEKVLLQPYSWEGLKRILRSGEIRIESLGQALSLISTVSLEPEPIPLKVKVVLLGERLLYYLLCRLDSEFTELFKVAADFEDHVDRKSENTLLYSRLIATMARTEKLRPLARSAVARVIEHSGRLVEDSEKLSLHQGALKDLLQEADYWAQQNGNGVIDSADIQRAIDAQIFRSDRLRERIQEEICRGTLIIDTEGEQVGQVNGLSVMTLDRFSFGRPSRITARARLGKGEVIDIEREVELGGALHSKGVLILSGFLGARYSTDRPLSLSATLVFEQSYGEVEGDSASSAELYALLSALADVPIKQSLAVTGSVNQHGQVQAIGGVNEKIEGFFDLCRARGLTGDQGVLIPASNVKHLMLREDVVEAAASAKFHIYPVETIDQGIELLTGVPAGQRDRSGQFPTGTLNRKVEDYLNMLAEKQAAFSGSDS